jgi:alpha-tubulin suppressor-like RCC1 family protein
MGWGQDIFSQLGDESSTASVTKPVTVKGLSGATQIAAGRSHTLALLANGSVESWGFNNVGQLGDGTAGSTPTLTPAPVPELANVVAIAAGEFHSLALLANGTVMAWGVDNAAQLGLGNTTGPNQCAGTVPCSKKPIQVPGLSGVVAIAAAANFSLALRADGTVVAWGQDLNGQLGDGIDRFGMGCGCLATPTAVPGVSGAVAISAGLSGGAALIANGTVTDWGQNDSGELGNGTIQEAGCFCSGPVVVSGLSGAEAIAKGGLHGLATLASGPVQAWGFDAQGELGNESSGLSSCGCVPVPDPVHGLTDPQQIAGGDFHSLALRPDSSVVAWGHNGNGRLGDGTEEDRNVPTPVSGISGASAVAAGSEDSFALIGPSQTLKVSLVGAGSGAVGTQGLLCPPACEERYPQSQVEILRAEPSPGSGFAGFSGPCTGTGPCQLKMDSERSLTATFGPPKGTAIAKAKIVKRKGRASFSFTAPGAITGFQCKLIRPKSTARKRHRRRKARFQSCRSAKTYKHLVPGRYTFKVGALDILGADANPAKRKFKLKKRRR